MPSCLRSLKIFKRGFERMAGWTVWITGLPGSGKSTVTRRLVRKLHVINVEAQVLSSDALRKLLTPKATYSDWERDMVYEGLARLAALLAENDVNVIIDATGNHRRYRDRARRLIPRFLEVYLKCSLDVCIRRESSRRMTRGAPRRIYQRAKEKAAPGVPGMGAPYEEPLHPELTLESDRLTVEECAEVILRTIQRRFLSAKK
ncbi:MAG: adenylyl-sulfate kinase [Candidatus Bathyarchaeia archaeon]